MPVIEVRVLVSLMLSLMTVSSAAAIEPASVENSLRAGLRNVKKKEFAAAQLNLQAVVKAEPNWVSAHTALGDVYYGLKQYTDAEREYAKALELIQSATTPAEALKIHAIPRAVADTVDWKTSLELDLHSQRAQAEYYSGHYKNAVADLTWSIEHGGANEDLFLQRASALDALGDTKAAIADIGRALETRPNSSDLLLRRALLHKHLDDTEHALADFNDAIKLNPALVTWRASFHLDQGKTKAAIEDFTQAIACTSGCGKADELCNRATVYADLDEHRKAIDDLNHAIKLKPNKADYFACRGVSYFGVSDFKRAISDFSQAIKYAPNDADNYFKRAEALAVDGQKEKALKDYDEAVKLNPHKAALYYFRRALVNAELGKGEQAIADLTHATDLEPRNAEYWFNRGLEYKSIGDNKAAETDFTKSIDLRPTFPSAYKHRAIVRSKQGNTEGAIADLQKSIELYRTENDSFGVAEANRLISRLAQKP